MGKKKKKKVVLHLTEEQTERLGGIEFYLGQISESLEDIDKQLTEIVMLKWDKIKGINRL